MFHIGEQLRDIPRDLRLSCETIATFFPEVALFSSLPHGSVERVDSANFRPTHFHRYACGRAMRTVVTSRFQAGADLYQ